MKETEAVAIPCLDKKLEIRFYHLNHLSILLENNP
jgi:hypothetical protein